MKSEYDRSEKGYRLQEREKRKRKRKKGGGARRHASSIGWSDAALAER